MNEGLMEEEERASMSYRYGLDLQKDLDILRLNYGLLVANQDRFHEAASILAPMIETTTTSRDSINNNNTDAFQLWKFCNDKSN